MNGVMDSKGGTENVERMLRRFKKVSEAAGTIAEVKKRRSFEKPSETKRRKKNDAVRRVKMDRMAAPRAKKRSKSF